MKSVEKEIFPALIIIDEEVEKASNFPNRLVCNNPKYIFSLILQEFFKEKMKAGIGDGSIVSSNALLHEGVSIGIDCVLRMMSVLVMVHKYIKCIIRKGTVIGENCIIKSGTVIGEEGYGYSRNGDKIIHVPHFGHVILEDEVERDSNCSIDCGWLHNLWKRLY